MFQYPVIYQPSLELDTFHLSQVKFESTEIDATHLRIG
jgi:hypothetical protein